MNIQLRLIRRFALLSAIAVAVATWGPYAAAQDDELASAKLRVDWTTFKAKYDGNQVVVVDVRDSMTFKTGHIPGARSIPLADIDRAVDDLRKAKQPIVTYCACQSEHTSAMAAQTLQKHGLDARALIGGYNKWLDEKGKVERGPSPPAQVPAHLVLPVGPVVAAAWTPVIEIVADPFSRQDR
jgi:rhodanese-related sulfurtransferase